MTNLKRFLTILTLTGLFLALPIPTRAQNMGGTVVEKRVRFPRGSHRASVPGRAKYGMSYVYKLGARAGQNMNVLVGSKDDSVTFSVIAPNDDTLPGAFNVGTWSGQLPQSGDYSIVVVMNTKRPGSIPFTLDVTIQ